jgi:D-amino-acid dehydrogenase
MANSKRIIIAGGGVIGLATAMACQKAGHEVTIIDREPGPEDGCSYGNAGMVVPSHFIPLAAPGMVALGLKWMWNPESPFYIKPRLDWDLMRWGWHFMRAATAERVARAGPLLLELSLASRAAFVAMAEAGADFGLQRKGLLMLCQTQAALDEEAHGAQRARQLGLPAEVLDAAATRARDGAAAMHVVGSVYYPQDCHLAPNQYLRMMRESLRAGGATFFESTEITQWHRTGDRITHLTSTRGEHRGDEYVLCGGAWSPEVARQLDLSLPMQAGKGYSVTHPTPAECPDLCSILVEARVAVTPMPHGLRVGGTMEIAGVNHTVSRRRVDGILKSLERYYPKLTAASFADLPVWHGLRPCSPDGLPYVGRFRAFQNLSTATGHAMMGLSLAPVTGQIMAALLTGEDPGFDLTLLAPDRF